MVSMADCDDFIVELPAKSFHQGGSEGGIHITDYVHRWTIVSKVSPLKHIYNMLNFCGTQEESYHEISNLTQYY